MTRPDVPSPSIPNATAAQTVPAAAASSPYLTTVRVSSTAVRTAPPAPANRPVQPDMSILREGGEPIMNGT
ncbi:hypothetical protein GCM10010191_81050 [Actinomadura vinacea]|uniref:Uncharacterized protein n=1 Tax=Actinomadura vinacea TaxID=115336 RepID=A0ABN3K9P6_9ACTN